VGGFTFNYDAISRRTAMTLPNGTQTSYSYDVASQVQSILHKITATNTPINNADYLYNNVGNRTQLTDRRGAQSFGYDNLDRLTSATHPLPPTSQAFAYDPAGNRTSNGSLANAGNQLTENAQFIFEYDDNGNQIKKTSKTTNNFTVYTYDAENRLVKVEDFVVGNPTPTATSTYRHDGLGRRIEKVTPTGTRRYVYDGEDILLEYDGTNTLQARYTHGPGVDEPLAVTRGSSTYFYHADALGSVSELTDSAGAVAKAYAYDSYGNIVDQTGSIENNYAYTSREFDSETGLYYYRARSYDASSGRFLQKDPIGRKRGANLYPYVRNSPPNATDSTGLDPSLPPNGVGRASKPFVPKSDKRPLGTILCNDGNPEVWIQDYYNDQQSQECGLSECLFKHEGVHLADALARNPLVCSGTKKNRRSGQQLGPQIIFGNQLAAESEIRAYLVEKACLEDALDERKGNCPCEFLLKGRLGDVKDFLGQ
ncbi:MAG: RHS repeat-associated core domain-containing protein, partial [Nitrospira sp.]